MMFRVLGQNLTTFKGIAINNVRDPESSDSNWKENHKILLNFFSIPWLFSRIIFLFGLNQGKGSLRSIRTVPVVDNRSTDDNTTQGNWVFSGVCGRGDWWLNKGRPVYPLHFTLSYNSAWTFIYRNTDYLIINCFLTSPLYYTYSITFLLLKLHVWIVFIIYGYDFNIVKGIYKVFIMKENVGFASVQTYCYLLY